MSKVEPEWIPGLQVTNDARATWGTNCFGISIYVSSVTNKGRFSNSRVGCLPFNRSDCLNQTPGIIGAACRGFIVILKCPAV